MIPVTLNNVECSPAAALNGAVGNLPVFTTREDLLQFMRQVRARMTTNEPGPWYQPIPFPGYEDDAIRVWRENSDARLEKITEAVPLAGLNVLDVGCNIGSVAFQLARRGARVWGLDPDADTITVARSLAHMHRVENVSFLHGRLDEATVTQVLQQAGRVDVVLLLSVVHWLFLDDSDLRKIAWLINQLQHEGTQWIVYEPASAPIAYNPHLITSAGVREFFHKLGVTNYRRIGRFAGPVGHGKRDLLVGEKNVAALCRGLAEATESRNGYSVGSACPCPHYEADGRHELFEVGPFCLKTQGPAADAGTAFLINEADKLKRLRPAVRNVPLFYGSHKAGGRVYNVFERLPLPHLDRIKFSAADLDWLADEFAQLLTSLSSSGLAHNDFGPHNLLCDKTNRRLYLIDFEFATNLYEDQCRSLSDLLCDELPLLVQIEPEAVRRRIGALQTRYPSFGIGAGKAGADAERAKWLLNSIRFKTVRWTWDWPMLSRIGASINARLKKLLGLPSSR